MRRRSEMAHIVKPPCDEGVIRSAPESISVTSNIGPWVLAATILGSSMAFIDGTVVNVALPVLQIDLHATVADVQWVVEAYSLFLAALILVGGSLGDHFWSQACLLDRDCALHPGIGVVWSRAKRQFSYLCTCFSRSWWRLIGSGKPSHYQCFLRHEAARYCYWDLVGF